jgi:hypothetical protein
MQTVTLSAAALAVLKLHVTQERVMVDDANREAHRELARAGILYPLSGFASGPESHYRFTQEGWERREEFLSGSDRP